MSSVGPYTKAKRAAEDAAEGLVNKLKRRSLNGVTIFKGYKLEELTTPRLEIVCPECEPQYQGSVFECWIALLRFEVREHFKDAARATWLKYCGVVEKIIMRPDVANVVNNLTGIGPFTLLSGRYGWEPGKAIDGVDGNELVAQYLVQIRFMQKTT